MSLSPDPDAPLALIPARGGSKRLPGKNLLPFQGKPMIVWTIDAALGSGLFSRVLVSTDDPEIARVSAEAGAEAPFLRAEHGDDHAPVSAATLHALDQAERQWGRLPEAVVQLFACCPLRHAGHIQDAWDAFRRAGCDFQISAFRPSAVNPWAACTVDADGVPTRLHPQAYTARTQDLPPLYLPTGAIWIARVAALREVGSFYGPGHRYHPMPWEAAIDIDDAEDLRLADVIAATA